MQRYLIPILLVILALASESLAGCSSTSRSHVIPTKAEELSLDYHDDFMSQEDLACTFSRDVVEFYKEYGLKEEAKKLESARYVCIEPLRGSLVPYGEIEHLVKVYKTEVLTKEAFNEWDEPSGEWFLSWARRPIRYESILVDRIGDETKAWRTNKCEFVIVFHKGKVLEAIAVRFSYATFLGDVVCGKDIVRLKDKRLIEWSMELAHKAESFIPKR